MEIAPTDIAEVILVTPRIWADERGFFLESFNAREYKARGMPERFVQDNYSRSARGALRGLHYQLSRPQGKLVSVVRGRMFDVAADIRSGSPTYGRWVGVVLDDVLRQALWIPPGFAHGWCALSDEVDVIYKCTDYYDPANEHGIIWNDPTLAIDWPIDRPTVSDRDLRFRSLSPDKASLPVFEN